MHLTTILKLALLLSGAGLVAGIAVVALAGAPSAGQERLITTAGAIFGHSAIALGLAAARERGRARWLMTAGLLLAAVGVVTWISGWWGGQAPERGTLVLLVAMLSSGWATLLMIVGVELAQPANGPVAVWTQRVTIGLTAALAPLWTYAAPGPLWDAPWLVRTMAVVSILVVCGLLTSLVLARLHGLAATGRAAGLITVTCPRCGLGQRLILGGDECGGCGLRIRVDVP